MVTITWRGTATATASIAHGGETRGTITLLRRELILAPDGTRVHVPIISGNSFRGLLRRTGEELLRDTLNYEGELPLAAAHALRAGGSLAKTGKEPLSGRRLATLRSLVPHIGVFGCAGGGRIIDGCLQVGKVIPHLVETTHLITPAPPAGRHLATAFEATQIETYVRQDDADTHAFTALTSRPPTGSGSGSPGPLLNPVDPATGELTDDALAELTPSAAADAQDPTTRSLLMLYRIETFPAGTQFATWLRLGHATDLEAAFFADVLEAYTANARLGGRGAIGHGTIRLDLTTSAAGEEDPRDRVDWRAHLREHREDAMTALGTLA